MAGLGAARRIQQTSGTKAGVTVFSDRRCSVPIASLCSGLDGALLLRCAKGQASKGGGGDAIRSAITTIWPVRPQSSPGGQLFKRCHTHSQMPVSCEEPQLIASALQWHRGCTATHGGRGGRCGPTSSSRVPLRSSNSLQ